jgi:hypothetical protein
VTRGDVDAPSPSPTTPRPPASPSAGGTSPCSPPGDSPGSCSHSASSVGNPARTEATVLAMSRAIAVRRLCTSHRSMQTGGRVDLQVRPRPRVVRRRAAPAQVLDSGRVSPSIPPGFGPLASVATTPARLTMDAPIVGWEPVEWLVGWCSCGARGRLGGGPGCRRPRCSRTGLRGARPGSPIGGGRGCGRALV